MKAVVLALALLAGSGCDDPCSDGPPIAYASIVVDVRDEAGVNELWHTTNVWDGDELVETRTGSDQYDDFFGLYGVFAVEVSADGYVPMRFEDVEVQDIGGECPMPDGQQLTVRLVPE